MYFFYLLYSTSNSLFDRKNKLVRTISENNYPIPNPVWNYTFNITSIIVFLVIDTTIVK